MSREDARQRTLVDRPAGARPHVVVVGCGFGGLAAAKTLARQDVDVTLVDAANHHLFQPLLYQVATAGLSAPAIASPIRHILQRHRNVTTLMACALAVDVAGRRVQTSAGWIAYDALIVAVGAVNHWFGHDDWPAHAPAIKTLDDALLVRARVLAAFERAETAIDDDERQAFLTFAIVGAGPTGVELAGTLAEMSRHTLRREFRRTDPRAARVLLIEGGPRVLGALSERSSRRAQAQLERLGVEVRTGLRVTDIDAGGLDVIDAQGRAQRIAARTVLWAAGVRASPLVATLGVPTDRAGRVEVEPELSLPGQPEVYVIGDCASVPSHRPPVPGVAPAAKQMGRAAARNLVLGLRGRPRHAFRYVDYGTLATIGRNAAVAELDRFRFSGVLAWAFWLFVHIFFLIGFRNRFVVLIDWWWSYLTWERNARIIVSADPDAPAQLTRDTSAASDAPSKR